MYNINTPLRLLQLVLAVITVGLNGYVTKWYREHTLTSVAPNSTIFLMAVGMFTIVIPLPYLYFNPALRASTRGGQSGSSNGRFFNKYVVLALDILCMGLWFGGFVSLAQFQHRLILCGGHVCQIMAGGAVVGAVEFAIFAVMATFAGIHVLRTRNSDQTALGGGTAMTSHGAWVGGEVKG